MCNRSPTPVDTVIHAWAVRVIIRHSGTCSPSLGIAEMEPCHVIKSAITAESAPDMKLLKQLTLCFSLQRAQFIIMLLTVCMCEIVYMPPRLRCDHAYYNVDFICIIYYLN